MPSCTSVHLDICRYAYRCEMCYTEIRITLVKLWFFQRFGPLVFRAIYTLFLSRCNLSKLAHKAGLPTYHILSARRLYSISNSITQNALFLPSIPQKPLLSQDNLPVACDHNILAETRHQLIEADSF